MDFPIRKAQVERYKQFRVSPISSRVSISPLQTASNSPTSVSPSPAKGKNSLSPVKLPHISQPKRHLTDKKPLVINPGFSSATPCGTIHSYALNTYKNQQNPEDRVKILTNLPHPTSISPDTWPKSSVFALFDGKYGTGCSEYLKSNLWDAFFTHKNFPFRIKDVAKEVFSSTDEIFLKQAKFNKDISGSCALLLIIIGDKCFVVNSGDSKAVISLNGGKMVTALNAQHSVKNAEEQKRVVESGGKLSSHYIQGQTGENVLVGSPVIIPGRLKVSRGFGHIDAKDVDFGGNPKVIICEPEVKSFKIKPEQDFIVLASGSVWSKLSNTEVVQIVVNNLKPCKKEEQENEIGKCLVYSIDEIFRKAIKRGSNENMTVVIVVFKGIKKIFRNKEKVFNQ